MIFKFEVRDDIQLVQLTDWLAAPRQFTAIGRPAEPKHEFGKSFDLDWPYLVHLEIVFEGTNPVVESMSLTRLPGGPPLTSAWMRNARELDNVVSLCVKALLFRIGNGQQDFLLDEDQESRDRASVEIDRIGRRRSVTDEFLAEVAAVYTDALPLGAPTKAVAQRFHASHSTAARWVGKARQRGQLGPTEPGRSGTGTT